MEDCKSHEGELNLIQNPSVPASHVDQTCLASPDLRFGTVKCRFDSDRLPSLAVAPTALPVDDKANSSPDDIDRPSDDANPSPGDIDRLQLASPDPRSTPVKDRLASHHSPDDAWPPTGIPVAHQTSYKLCYPSGLRKASPVLARPCCHLSDLRRWLETRCVGQGSQSSGLHVGEILISVSVSACGSFVCVRVWELCVWSVLAVLSDSCVGCGICCVTFESSLASVALTSRIATVADTSPGFVLNLSHIQSQLGLLQSQLGYLLQQQPSDSTATLATGTPTAFQAKTSHLIWVLDSGVNDHMTGTLSLSSLDAAIILANLDELPRPIPLFDSPLVQVPPASAARAPLKVYTCRAPPRPLC
ncbi:hypothetical protein Acr_10g0005670 [Actinidia rufa]|uniref:Uncharacterized protein n=1 Tax=Actinidia rufa TaxID=165716 RepID=A0A7J0F8Z6_9ERIC|nr:hypothetical protein Acr_10g0005670 [Actinidia rufa]